MAQDLPFDSPLELALRRLDQALSMLQEKMATEAARQSDDSGDLFERRDAQHTADRARLAAELDAARAREKALEEVAAEASAALGRAASEVRAALAAGES